MSRKLTKKRQGFVKDYAETGNATVAVKNNYNLSDINDDNTAAAMGSEILRSPKVQQELVKLGFNAENAKRVVGEILDDETIEPKDRLKASELIFKVTGDFAAEKSINVNVNAEEMAAIIKDGIAKFKAQ